MKSKATEIVSVVLLEDPTKARARQRVLEMPMPKNDHFLRYTLGMAISAARYPIPSLTPTMTWLT